VGRCAARKKAFAFVQSEGKNYKTKQTMGNKSGAPPTFSMKCIAARVFDRFFADFLKFCLQN